MMDQTVHESEYATNSKKIDCRKIVFASDFDDTLYHHDKRGLLESDVEAIEKFQKAGNIFVLCTGRPAILRDDIQDLIKDRIRFDYEIYSCGSMILDQNQQVILSRALPETFVRKAAELTGHVPFKAHQKGRILYSANMDSLDADQGVNMKDPDLLLEDEVYEISFPKNDPLARQAIKALKLVPGAACYENTVVADFVRDDVSKATGLDFICTLEHVLSENSAAMGDSFNDFSMIEHAKTGFTFPDADQKLKEIADFEAQSVGEALLKLMDNRD
ncbi:HAD-IIB family hydrolase [Ileibacterium valens]|uniref:HAD-IIB family hydrolase n=1 Tax=Ileibacterium valens TaxID=1862668 RepID=UPI002729AC6E|nr:HAD-IIB family hydrolase [Ileibacterium valens]